MNQNLITNAIKRNTYVSIRIESEIIADYVKKKIKEQYNKDLSVSGFYFDKEYERLSMTLIDENEEEDCETLELIEEEFENVNLFCCYAVASYVDVEDYTNLGFMYDGNDYRLRFEMPVETYFEIKNS